MDEGGKKTRIDLLSPYSMSLQGQKRRQECCIVIAEKVLNLPKLMHLVTHSFIYWLTASLFVPWGQRPALCSLWGVPVFIEAHLSLRWGCLECVCMEYRVQSAVVECRGQSDTAATPCPHTRTHTELTQRSTISPSVLYLCRQSDVAVVSINFPLDLIPKNVWVTEVSFHYPTRKPCTFNFLS